MRRLQQQYKTDRQKLNEEMMKLYQEHKVNPMASCLPLLAQTPVFIVMFRILYDATYTPVGGNEAIARAVLTSVGRGQETIGFLPRYLSLLIQRCTRRSLAKLRCRHGDLTSQNHRRACWVATLAKASFMPALW